MTRVDINTKIEQLAMKRTPTADVQHEQAAALWFIGRQLQRIADVMEEAHK